MTIDLSFMAITWTYKAKGEGNFVTGRGGSRSSDAEAPILSDSRFTDDGDASAALYRQEDSG